MKEEHPPCLMRACPSYPCKILDPIINKPVICIEEGFWDKYWKEVKDIG